ncbi:MAG: tetratricopeptide repeat protein [Rhodoferax sp.]|nr:tetratricopeptide repeat protein [Rhodoferax sp.]
MTRLNHHSGFPASVVAAALLFAASLFSQPPAEVSAAPQPPSLPAATPLPAPTPEGIGDSMMAHRRYQAAIEAYKQVQKPSAEVWNKMGIAYQMLFNLQDATRCYETSLKMDPKSVNVLNNIGTIYDSFKQYGKAVKMYRKALKIDPKSALVLKNLGTDLMAQHKYEKGWEVYKSALAVDPQIFDRSNGPRVENPSSVQDRGAMNYYMAKGCVRAGKNDRAIEYLRSALNEGFTNPRKIANDQEFATLHGVPAFDRLIAEQQKQ